MEGKRPGERIESLNPLYTYCFLIWKVYCMVQERDDHLTITIFGACFSVIEGIEQTWWVNGGCILVLLSLAIYVDKQTYVMRSLRTFMGSSWVFISLLETHVLLSFLRWVNFLIICIPMQWNTVRALSEWPLSYSHSISSRVTVWMGSLDVSSKYGWNVYHSSYVVYVQGMSVYSLHALSY